MQVIEPQNSTRARQKLSNDTAGSDQKQQDKLDQGTHETGYTRPIRPEQAWWASCCQNRLFGERHLDDD